MYRVSSAHEEGGDRLFSVNTERFVDDGNGRVRALLLHEVEMVDGRFQKIEGSDRELPADFVFLAMGFVGPEKGSWLDQLGVSFDERGNVARDGRYMSSRARRVRCRRHGPRAEPDRVGHRRGPFVRGGRRRLADGRDAASRRPSPPTSATTAS